MSHDLQAAWAATEIASVYRRQPAECFETPPRPADLSVTATRESRRTWPICDGVIQVVRQPRNESYEIALEFKRPNEGVHGVLTAIGQSHAYLHKGFAASVIVIPKAYESHVAPGEHAAGILTATSPDLPIGLFVYDEPDPSITSPFAGKMRNLRRLRLDTGVVTPGTRIASRVETQWGHVREGSTDPHAFFRYLQTAKQLCCDALRPPRTTIPPELVAACHTVAPGCVPMKYLSYATQDTFHDYVWRTFWLENVLHDAAIQIWQRSATGTYSVNGEASLIRQPNGRRKLFFVGRSDSRKNRLVVSLNAGDITEDEAWQDYARNVHARAHSYREDIDSGLAACGLLEPDGRPTDLGYRFVDSCERTRSWDTGTPKALLVAALLKNADFGALLHYVHRLSETRFKNSPLAFTTGPRSAMRFDQGAYRAWLVSQLAGELGVMRTVSARGGRPRRPLQAELSIMRQFGLVSGFRPSVGLEIDWPAVQNGLDFAL